MTPGLVGRLELTTAEKSDATRKRKYEGKQTGVAYALRVWRREDTAIHICRFIAELNKTERTLK